MWTVQFNASNIHVLKISKRNSILLRRRSITQKYFNFKKKRWVGSPVSTIKQNFILGLKKKRQKIYQYFIIRNNLGGLCVNLKKNKYYCKIIIIINDISPYTGAPVPMMVTAAEIHLKPL